MKKMNGIVVSVVIPTYNEEGNIGKLIKSILELDDLPSCEILVVDDNSSDNTRGEVKEIAKKYPSVRIVKRIGQERGLGLSIGDGIREAKGKLILGMDADGNHDPIYVPKMFKAWMNGGGLVVGSRYVGKNRGRGIREFLPSFLFNILARLLGMPIWDNSSGYYLFERNKINEEVNRQIFYGYGDYHLRLVWYFMKKGERIFEVPIVYGKREKGKSKSNKIKMFVGYIAEVIRLRAKR